jgi:hypothetical protein
MQNRKRAPFIHIIMRRSSEAEPGTRAYSLIKREDVCEICIDIWDVWRL